MNDRQLALSLAVQTLANSPGIERNQGDWVIDLAKRYEEFLSEKSTKDVTLFAHEQF